MRFGGRGGAFSFPQVFHTHSQSVCFVFCPKGEGRGGRKGKGLRNGLFLDGGEYGMVQEEGNCCLHTSPSQSGMDLHPPSRLAAAGTNRSSRHHHRRMDGWQRSQSNIHQHPWEGADITEGRLLRGEEWRGGVSLAAIGEAL